MDLLGAHHRRWRGRADGSVPPWLLRPAAHVRKRRRQYGRHGAALVAERQRVLHLLRVGRQPAGRARQGLGQRQIPLHHAPLRAHALARHRFRHLDWRHGVQRELRYADTPRHPRANGCDLRARQAVLRRLGQPRHELPCGQAVFRDWRRRRTGVRFKRIRQLLSLPRKRALHLHRPRPDDRRRHEDVACGPPRHGARAGREVPHPRPSLSILAGVLGRQQQHRASRHCEGRRGGHGALRPHARLRAHLQGRHHAGDERRRWVSRSR